MLEKFDLVVVETRVLQWLALLFSYFLLFVNTVHYIHYRRSMSTVGMRSNMLAGKTCVSGI